MPPIKGIDLSDGIRIVGSGVPNSRISLAEIEALHEPNASKLEQTLTALLQANYEEKTLLSDYPPEDPVSQGQLLINERIERISGKDYVVAITMYVAVHVFSTNPLKYTLKTQDSRLGPIGGEWWP